MGSGSPCAQCLTVGEQWSVDLLSTPPHCLGSSGQWIDFNTLPRCTGAAGGGTSTIHCLGAWVQWKVVLLEHGAPSPLWEAVSTWLPSVQCLVVGDQWATDLVHSTASLLGSMGSTCQWASFITMPHCLGAVGGASPSMLPSGGPGHCVAGLPLSTAP